LETCGSAESTAAGKIEDKVAQAVLTIIDDKDDAVCIA
jgi:hypothetical protein